MLDSPHHPTATLDPLASVGELPDENEEKDFDVGYEDFDTHF